MTSKSTDRVTNQVPLHSKYRADIDGLRAMAILSVVAFHAFPKTLKGGFVGVDIFFVISGFLISTIIFESLERRNFSFAEFYSRRIRRIFPALLVVLISCFALGWFALLADEYKQLGKHIAGGAGFMSNFIFWKESGYFDNSAEAKPLLHLWSLAIEEQFYIIWPLILWSAWKLRINFLAITIIFATSSFLLNLKGINSDMVAAFYSPQSRFWEILIGGALAYIKRNSNLSKIFLAQYFKTKKDILLNTQSVLGLALITAGVLLITKERSFPGWWALLPTMGTVLIISAGDKAWFNRVVLSNRIMVWFGLISFPLYLWHWPLLSFARIVEGEALIRNIRIIAVLMSVVLAWFTYVLIEKPFRFGKFSKIKTIILMMLMLIMGIVGFNSYIRDGLKFRDAEKNAEKIANFNDFTFPPTFRNSCPSLKESSDSGDWCNDGNIDKNPSVVLLGDSIATSYSQLLLSLNKEFYFSFKQYGRGQCPPLLNFGPKVCSEASQYYFDLIKNTAQIKTVILAAQWPMYAVGKNYDWLNQKTTVEEFATTFKETIDYLTKLDKKIIIFLAPPLGASPRNCVRPFKITNHKAFICDLPLELALVSDTGSNEIIKKLVLTYPQVKIFDPFKYLCDATACKVIDNQKILYIDSAHMSLFGGEFLAAHAKEELKELISNQR